MDHCLVRFWKPGCVEDGRPDLVVCTICVPHLDRPRRYIVPTGHTRQASLVCRLNSALPRPPVLPSHGPKLASYACSDPSCLKQDPIHSRQGMCAHILTRRSQPTRNAPHSIFKKPRNLNCRVSLSTLEQTDWLVLLTLYFDKRNCGDSDPVHSIHLLIHHRAVDCGVKNRPDGIRFGPNPGSPVQPCQPFNTFHTIKASRTPQSFCPCPSFKDDWSTHQYMLASSSRYQSLAPPKTDPLRLIKKVISLYLAQNKRTPCIPADRHGPGCRPPPPTVEINPVQTVRMLAVQPTFVVCCMYLHTESLTHCFHLLCQPSCIALQHPA